MVTKYKHYKYFYFLFLLLDSFSSFTCYSWYPVLPVQQSGMFGIGVLPILDISWISISLRKFHLCCQHQRMSSRFCLLAESTLQRTKCSLITLNEGWTDFQKYLLTLYWWWEHCKNQRYPDCGLFHILSSFFLNPQKSYFPPAHHLFHLHW